MSVFVTTERLRQLPSLKEADEAHLANLAAAACEAVERWCKRRFALTTYTDEVHDGDGTRTLFVDNFPVTEISGVTLAEAGGEVEIAASDFEMRAATGELRLKEAAACGYAALPRGLGNVRVTYTAGSAEVGEDVVEAAAQLAAHLHGAALRAGGVRSERLGQISRSFREGDFGEIPGGVRALLAPYRNVRV